MSRLNWNAVGDRLYETGVDRGVFYPKVGPGVPWDGLISVTEQVSGGNAVPYYMDGIKYLNLSAAEEYKAKIQAFSSPQEFDLCDGSKEIAPGLSGMHQPRQAFGFTYRTGIGNDLKGIDFGYQIHLVYGAMANPASRDHNSLSNSPEAMPLSWDIETVPPLFDGYKPSAHFVIDSTITHPSILDDIEAILYGGLSTNPSLPHPSVIVEAFATMIYSYGHGPYGSGPYGGSGGGGSTTYTYGHGPYGSGPYGG